MNKAVTTRKQAAVALHEEFDKRAQEFAAILPQDVSLAEFKRVTLQSIAMNPRLLECTQVSVFRALTEAARHGWVPDGRDCYIDIRENFKTGEMTALCIPGKHGYLKNFIGKTLRDWRAHVVRRGDNYDVELGDNEKFTHKVDPFAEGGDDGEIIGAYSIAIGMDGRIVSREFMSLAQLLKARAKSSSYNGKKPEYSPWSTHFEEMCEKTVMKRHADRLPKEAKAATILAGEREIEAENAKLLAEPKKTPKRNAGKAQTRALENLGNGDASKGDPEWNGDGGEASNGRQNSRNAQSAGADTSAPSDGSRTKQENSPATSDASREPTKRGPGRPRKDDQQQRQEPAREARQADAAPPKSNGGGDPINDAMEAGEAAYEAGISRNATPREYQSDDRWDELDAWLEGWDNASADSAAGRVMS